MCVYNKPGNVRQDSLVVKRTSKIASKIGHGEIVFGSLSGFGIGAVIGMVSTAKAIRIAGLPYTAADISAGQDTIAAHRRAGS